MKTVLILVSFALISCGDSVSADLPLPEAPDNKAFADHWYQGKAELTRYQLQQSRYGQNHEGDAVLIFVTEPFLEKEQVKHEYGDGASHTVLKLNATRKFLTGVYPYSLMTSVFTRADFAKPETVKVSFSAQEWCGHAYMQLNRSEKGLHGRLHSYFQKEGDQEMDLPNLPTEDGVWTRLRIAPRELPQGKLEMVPALHFLRLDHVETKAYPVEAKLEKSRDKRFGKDLLHYSLTYEGIERKLDIFFESKAPHRIMGWTESGRNGGQTVATRTHETMLDYWSKNRPEHRELRKDLGLAQ